MDISTKGESSNSISNCRGRRKATHSLRDCDMTISEEASCATTTPTPPKLRKMQTPQSRKKASRNEREKRIRRSESATARSTRLAQQRRRRNPDRPLSLARNCENAEVITEHSCGNLDGKCSFCKALYFQGELTTTKQYNHCCHKGKISLPNQKYPPNMKSLITGSHVRSSSFKQHIRSYNSSLAFASFGANLCSLTGRGPYTFKIHGQIYHNVKSLYPEGGSQPKYGQLYILDSECAVRERMKESSNASCLSDVLQSLDKELRTVSPFAKSFAMMHEYERQVLRLHGPQASSNVCMWFADHPPSALPLSRYAPPTCNEIAVVFSSDDGSPPNNRDICIYPNRVAKKSISALSPNCDPMTYPLLFPYGDKGWAISDQYTILQYYSFRLSCRESFSPIFHASKLLQQYTVDGWIKVESSRLSWVQSNQKKLRVDSYMGLMDFVTNTAEGLGLKAGVPVILPSTFIGSPRHMQQNFQDAMAIVRIYGKPDIFLTFTCNPNWSEITNNLLPGQRSEDRPDIVSRVFDLKRKALLNSVLVDHVLGKVVAYIYVIEFQKRGLPHMHLLLHLAEESKIRSPDEIDRVVTAELPCIDTQPQLYQIIKSNMIHGPCGHLNPNSPCMKEGKCSKNYPKSLAEMTIENGDGYPIYRRRINNRTVTVRNIDLDNSWVVPYNPYLSKMYNAHINVEVCNSIQAIKYLYKYVYKGHDCINLEFQKDDSLRWDEIAQYLNARYVSACEAIWRLFEKPLYQKSHSVFRLAVHIEDMQQVYFADDNAINALATAENKKTHITAWFQLNQDDESAINLLYTEVPKYFNFTLGKWVKKKHTTSVNKIIPRMYAVSPKDVEKYHLRMLLMHVTGAKSYADIKSYDGTTYSTYKEACRARGLLADDTEWFNALQEASLSNMPRQMRQLFAFLCVFCQPDNPLALFNAFKHNLIEDFLLSQDHDVATDMALSDIAEMLIDHGSHLHDFNLPNPQNITPRVLHAYNRQLECDEGERLLSLLNEEQTFIFNYVMSAIHDNSGINVISVSAAGGCGKSFLFNCLITTLLGSQEDAVVISTAWTGLAANLLKNGRTCHNVFKLPIPLNEASVCSVKQGTAQARELIAAKLIIIDECTMTPRHALSAIDRLLKDLLGNDQLMGGKVILLGGDWRQSLPIKHHASKTKILEECIMSYPGWHSFKHMTLTRNMRTDPDELEFANWLLQLGCGSLSNLSNLGGDVIEIPNECIVPFTDSDSAIQRLINSVFGNVLSSYSPEEFIDRAILCPKNEDCFKINEQMLNMMPGEVKTYYSVDSATSEEKETIHFPLEYLNSITPSGMPLHKLNLKTGCIIMLLRNMNTKQGLCNGTRLVVKVLHPHLIEAEVLTGRYKGNIIFIPRITLVATNNSLPFQLKRVQFPVRVSFCMTITKSQGQSFLYVGIYLPQPVFTHGQLYVAFSRGKRKANVKVLVCPSSIQGCLVENSLKVFTKNIVFKEIFKY